MVYCQFQDEVGEYLNRLQIVLEELGTGARVVIGIDSNATSTFWDNPETDSKGQALGEFILRNDLIISNEFGQTKKSHFQLVANPTLTSL